jgi:hypothetical protein
MRKWFVCKVRKVLIWGSEGSRLGWKQGGLEAVN